MTWTPHRCPSATRRSSSVPRRLTSVTDHDPSVAWYSSALMTAVNRGRVGHQKIVTVMALIYHGQAAADGTRLARIASGNTLSRACLLPAEAMQAGISPRMASPPGRRLTTRRQAGDDQVPREKSSRRFQNVRYCRSVMRSSSVPGSSPFHRSTGRGAGQRVRQQSPPGYAVTTSSRADGDGTGGPADESAG